MTYAELLQCFCMGSVVGLASTVLPFIVGTAVDFIMRLMKGGNKIW